jgi:hypothetical protein
VRCSVDRCLSFCHFSSDCPCDLVSSTFLMTVPLGKAIHMLRGKQFDPVTLTFDLENQQGSRFS